MADNRMTFDEFDLLTRGATPAPSGEAQPSVTAEEFSRMTAPPPPPSVGFGEDVGRSALAGATSGTAKVAGIPGDIGRIWPAALGWASRKMGAPESAAQAIERGIGAVSLLGYLPSSQQTEAAVKRAIPAMSSVMEYKPETKAGAYAKSIGEEAPLALIPGGGFGIGARLVGAGASGLASEGVRQAFKGKPGEGSGYQTAAEIAAPLLAGPASMFGVQAAGRGVKTLASPITTLLSPANAEAKAGERLAASMGADMALDQSATGSAATQALREAGATGVSPSGITPSQLAGTETRRVGAIAAGKQPEALQKYNEKIAQGAAEATEDMRSYLAGKVGRQELVFSNEMNAVDDLKSAVNNPNYTRVMALPEAQSIPTTEFRELFNQPLFRSQWDEANSVAASLKDKYGLQIPGKTQEGNLAYWDFMKRHFDRLGEAETIGTKADAYREIAKKIRDRADTVIPDYKKARDEAAEIFGYRNAMEMGRDYLNFSNARWKNLTKIEKDIFNTMSPQEMDRLRLGAAVALTEKMITPKSPDNIMKLYDQIGSSEMQRRLAVTFGEDGKNEILGRATQNALKAKAKPIEPGEFSRGATDIGKEYGTGIGVTAGALAIIPSLISQTALFNPDWKNISAAIGLALYGKAVSASEAKIAEQALRLLNSPEGTVRLGQLMYESPKTRSFLAKLDGFMSKTATQQAVTAAARSQASNITQEPRELTIRGERPQRATGGRTGAMTADKLIIAAERAKKSIGKDTEALLSTPDASVARALAVANQKLEG